MGMSDCEKCWNGICECGFEYAKYSEARLEEQISIMKRVLGFKKQYPTIVMDNEKNYEMFKNFMDGNTKYKIGDEVNIDGRTSFYTSYKTTVKAIEIKFDELSGKPYNVVVSENNSKYNEDTSECLEGARMYYLRGIV